MQPFECTGLWWLPGQENAHVGGTLKVSGNGNLNLSLMGMLGSQSPPGSKNHPVILGSVDGSPTGNDITLARCMLAGSTFGSFKNVRERYHPTRGFFGAHLMDKSDFTFHEAAVRIRGLTEWAETLSGFVLESQIPPLEEKVSLASYTAHPPISADIPGGKVLMCMGFSVDQSLHELNFREEGSLSIVCETPKSADEINGEFIYPLQNLMTFVCDRAQEVESFNVWPKPATANLAENPKIQVIGARVQPVDEEERKEPVRAFQMLFTLKDVEFADFVGKWMRLMDRYSAACNIFFGLKYGPPAFLDLTFMGTVQVLQLYHSRREDGMARRASEEMRLKQILTALGKDHGDWVIDHVGARPYPPFEDVLRQLVNQQSRVLNPLISNRQDRFVSEVMNTLQYLIHREREIAPAASHGADLYWMMEKLRFLIKACLMSELGFSQEKIVSLLERNALYQHVRQLEASLESRRTAT